MRNQTANGYEFLRELTLEFSLRSRSEALSLRTALASKNFTMKDGETTKATQVADVVCAMVV